MKKVIVSFSLIFCTSSYAWFMQPNDFFQTWAAQNKTPQTMLIKQERDVIVGGAISQTIPETVKIKRPGMYKWTSEIPGLEEVRVLGKSKATMGSPKSQRDVPLKNVLTPIEVVMIYSNAGNIESVLKQIDIDTSQSKLELVQKNKEVRIGDGKGNRIFVSPDKNTLDAMIFQNKLYLFKYNPDKFSFYPSEIDIYEGEILKEKVRTKSILSNAKISDAEFESN